MRILVAPDCFTGTLTAPQAAEAIAAGWSRGAPQDEVRLLPLADGGPGFLDTVHRALGGELVPVTVEGPTGSPTPAVVLLVGTVSGPVAYLEAAQAVGLDLVPLEERDPTRTTSRGLGQLLAAALDLGPTRVVVGLGGSATNDAGAGMLHGLGLTAGVLAGGGGPLGETTAADLAGLGALRRRLAGLDLVIAADVDVPLLGLHGASAGFAEQKGASPQQAQDLERALGHFAHLVVTAAARDGVRTDLLAGGSGVVPAGGAAGSGRSLTQLPGAGAAGGIGFALAVLGGRVVPGAQVVAEAVDLDGAVRDSDVVVTGEGSLDWQSLHGKVVSAVAGRAMAHGVPVVVVAGQVLIGRREWGAAGIAGVYAVAERTADVPAVLADPAGTLAARAERVGRTWSR